MSVEVAGTGTVKVEFQAERPKHGIGVSALTPIKFALPACFNVRFAPMALNAGSILWYLFESHHRHRHSETGVGDKEIDCAPACQQDAQPCHLKRIFC